jgi:hypothetical protein
MNKYTKRLLEEWNTHRKIVVAVDFDDTIKPWKFVSQQQCESIINLLKDVKKVGAYLTVFTASSEDRYEEVRQYCFEKGLEIDSINTNPIDLPYGHSGKVFANIYIDDRAGLEESLKVLEECMYLQRAYIQSKIHRDEIG